MVLICGDVAEPDDYPDCGLPPDPVGFWFFGRLQIRKFRCQVQMCVRRSHAPVDEGEGRGRDQHRDCYQSTVTAISHWVCLFPFFPLELCVGGAWTVARSPSRPSSTRASPCLRRCAPQLVGWWLVGERPAPLTSKTTYSVNQRTHTGGLLRHQAHHRRATLPHHPHGAARGRGGLAAGDAGARHRRGALLPHSADMPRPVLPLH